jgi:citrate synthase
MIMRYQGTDIDGPCTDPDGLGVRGIDLNELIGSKSFLECFFLAMYSKFPSEKQLSELNRFFNDGFRSIDREDPLFRIIAEVARSEDESLNGLIAGLAIDRKEEIKRLTPPDLGDIAVSENVLSGFYFMSILPIISGAAALYPKGKDLAPILGRLVEARQLEGNYADRIACFFRGRPFDTPGERRLMESLLVAFCAGFGYLTPSIMTPRISIGSGVSVGIAIIAGCTTAGPWHLGTSKDVMAMFRQIQQERNGQPLEAYVDGFLKERFAGGRKLLGFGHPFFKKDPRVRRLVQIIGEEGFHHEIIDVFTVLSAAVAEMKNIYPNLETGHGAIMLSMGFDIPFFGPSIALIGRSAGMVAHMEERLSKPAFGVKNNVARNFFDKVPMEWL